jgi:uncharacterized membrane protein YfcA
VSIELALVCLALSVIGSTVQASIGLGYGLLASPWLAMIDHDFVPVAILLAILPMTASVAIASRADVDRGALGWSLIGRIPGVIAAAFVVAAVSARGMAIGLGLAVLVAVAVSLWSPPFQASARSITVAGTVSGFMGTTTGVGGPPMAIVFQRSHPPMVRATLAAYFTVGSVISMIALTLSGDVPARSWRLAALLLPGVVAGLWLSRHVRHHLIGHRFRTILLTVSAASAVVLLVDNLR